MARLTPAHAITLMIAAIGVAVFWTLALPLPFLLGPLASCLVAALLGVPMASMGRVGVGVRTILGLAVGASVTPALLARLPEMAYTVALVPLLLALAFLAGYPFLRRVCGYDHPTAYYAVMPGGLQEMVTFGVEAGGNARALSLVHATRITLIVGLAPFLITGFWGIPLDAPLGQPASAIGWDQWFWLILAALGGWWLGARVGLFGAAILGPLILSAALSLGGLLTTRPPAELILAAQFVIGTSLGIYYVGLTGRELRRDVLAGAGYFAILAAIAFVMAEAVALLGFAPSLEAFLAFAPGGQAEMAVLALVAGADLAYVVTHHLVRVVLVIAGAPLAARWAGRLDGRR